MRTKLQDFVTRYGAIGLLFLAQIVWAQESCAQGEPPRPRLVYRYENPKSLEPTAVDGLVAIGAPSTEDGSGCEQRLGSFTIDDIAYEGTSDVVGGIRTKSGVITIDSVAVYRSLANAERSWVNKLLTKGAKVNVRYQVCGSGGYASAIDIYRQGAIRNRL